MKPKIKPPSEIEIDFKEYERLLGYKKAWKELEKELEDEIKIASAPPIIRPEFIKYGVQVHKWTLNKMTEILKQCTQKKKKEDLPSFDDMKGIFRNKKEG